MLAPLALPPPGPLGGDCRYRDGSSLPSIIAYIRLPTCSLQLVHTLAIQLTSGVVGSLFISDQVLE